MLRDFQKIELLEALCKKDEVLNIFVKEKDKLNIELGITAQDIDDLVAERKSRILLENGNKDAFEKLKGTLTLCNIPLESLEYTLKQSRGYNGDFKFSVTAVLSMKQYDKLCEMYEKLGEE